MRHPSTLVFIALLAVAACRREEPSAPVPSGPVERPPATAPSAAAPAPGPTEPGAPPVRRKSELPKSGAGSIVGDCEANGCPPGQECVLIEVHCIRAPCPPQPECVLP